MSKNLIDEVQDNTNDFSYLISSERNNNDNNNNNEKINKTQNKKKVKFTSEVIIINVECWKEYNMEQCADENFDNINEEENNIENNEENNNNSNNNNNVRKKRTKSNNVVCSCNLI